MGSPFGCSLTPRGVSWADTPSGIFKDPSVCCHDNERDTLLNRNESIGKSEVIDITFDKNKDIGIWDLDCELITETVEWTEKDDVVIWPGEVQFWLRDLGLGTPPVETVVARCGILENNSKPLVYVACLTSEGHPLLALLDTGAESTFVSEQTAERTNVRVINHVGLTVKGINQSTKVDSKRIILQLKNIQDSGSIDTLGFTIPAIPYRSKVVVTEWEEEKLRAFRNKERNPWVVLSEEAHNDREIDVIIGGPLAWKLLETARWEDGKSGRKVLLLTVGITLSVESRGLSEREQESLDLGLSELEVSSQCGRSDVEMTARIRALTVSDILGERSEPCLEKERVNRDVVQRYLNEVIVKNGTIEVRIPFNGSETKLADNYALALNRLRRQHFQLSSKREQMLEYHKQIRTQVETGIVEIVPEVELEAKGKIVYVIPHSAVVKESSNTTKVRVVMDCSSHGKGELSLNECAYPGPDLMVNLIGMLIRVRLATDILVGDVEKAFHMIRLARDHRDSVRFLWWKNPLLPPTKANVVVLRFARIPFGLNSSPFLLNVSILAHMLANVKEGREKMTNIYVDNLMLFGDGVEQMLELYVLSKRSFQEIGLNLREYSSNLMEVNEQIPAKDRLDKDSTSLLGMKWNRVSDLLSFQFPKPEELNPNPVTKRKIFAIKGRLFDPLGLLTPITLKMKMLVSAVCDDGKDWDDPIGEDQMRSWTEALSEWTPYSYQIPRPGWPRISVGKNEMELVVFADASKKFHAAVAYLVRRSGSVTHTLLVKAVSHINQKVTFIPRLEAESIKLAVKLAEEVMREVKEPLQSIRIYNDNTAAIAWAKTGKAPNEIIRVVRKTRLIIEQLDLIRPTDVEFVPTKENPADLATRGCSLEALKQHHLWWNGPSFLLKPRSEWPQCQERIPVRKEGDKRDQAMGKEEIVSGLGAVEIEEGWRSVVPFEKHRSFKKLIGIMSRVFIVISNLARRNVYKKLNNVPKLAKFRDLEAWERYETASQFIIRDHYKEMDIIGKLNPARPSVRLAVDDNLLIRCETRLVNGEVSEWRKRPIYLQAGHPLVEAVIWDIHREMRHGGLETVCSQLREHFWVCKDRKWCQKVQRSCTICNRENAHPYRYPDLPPLPADRTTVAAAFKRIGLDYYGPMRYKGSRGDVKTLQVMLITCMTTRAVHLEPVPTSDTSQFLMAFRRFVARRGCPEKIILDNQTAFKCGLKIIKRRWVVEGENKEVFRFLAEKKIEVRHITPISPWKGGFYERLVGVAKKLIRKASDRKLYYWSEFITVLVEVEAIMNSRPIVKNPCDIADHPAIRPIDFIHPYARLAFPSETVYEKSEFEETVTEEEAGRIFVRMNAHFENLWREWRSKYLAELRDYHAERGKYSKIEIMKNQVVIVDKDMVGRHEWPLGIIVDLEKGKDGVIRSAIIRLADGSEQKRSVNMLVPLEGVVSVTPTERREKNTLPLRSQPPRRAKEMGIVHRKTRERETIKQA